MTTSNYMPDVQVEIAFDSGYSTPAESRTWTDVSEYVELEDQINISHGRADEFAVTDANSLTLTLDNTDGRFTAGKTDGAYYPNVKIGRPIRVTATPVGGTSSVRFVGYVDEWPVAWDVTDNYAKVQISARSRMARLGFGAQLRSVAVEQVAHDGAIAFYPLGEPAGSLVANTVLGDTGPLSIFHNSGNLPLTFGADDLLPGEGTGVAFNFDQVDFTFGDSLRGDLGTSLTMSNGVSLEAVFHSTGNDDGGVIASLSTPPGSGSPFTNFQIRTSLDGNLGIGYLDALGHIVSGFTADTFDDGLPHHVYAYGIHSVAGITLRLYVDGVLLVGGTEPAFDDGNVSWLQVGGGNTVMSLVAIGADEAGVADRVASAFAAFDGEPASDRIERYANYAGIPSSEYAGDPDTNPVDTIDTTGLTAIDAMRKVEVTENGVLFDARDNALTFHGRAHRYNSVPVFTLDAELQEVEADVQPKLDRSTLVNEVTATASDGTLARASDQASIDDYGFARRTVEIASSQDAALQAGSWRVGLYAEPKPRIPALGVNLLPLSQARQDSLLELDVSSVLTVSGMPTQAPAASSEFFVEGYTESIGHESYGFVFNVSPRTAEYDVWVLEDPVFGAYDSNPLAY